MIKTWMKFALVGLSGTVVNMVMYFMLTKSGCYYLLAAIYSFIGAVVNNFLWNMLWTFRGRALKKSVSYKFVSFFVISLTNLGLNLVILRFLVEFLFVKEIIAQVGAIAIASVLNFILNHLITFAEKRSKKNDEVAPYETCNHSNL